MQMLILQIRIRLVFLNTLVWVSFIARPVSVGRSANIRECCIIYPIFIGLRKLKSYWSVCFSLWFLLVTANRQNSHDSGILRQDCGSIRGFIGHHQSANLVWIWYPSSRLRTHTKFADESYEACRFTNIGPDRAGLAKLQSDIFNSVQQ